MLSGTDVLDGRRGVGAVEPGRPLAVIGEAIMDLVPADDGSGPVARPGGSPFNVAVGLARLGHAAHLVARLSRDGYGRVLRTRAAANGVLLDHAVDVDEATSTAEVSFDATGTPTYVFAVDGTADWGWPSPDAAPLPEGAAIAHFGSIASWHDGSAPAVRGWAVRARAAGLLVSYDPNVRPLLQPDRALALQDVEECIALADVAKASEEDLRWLYPGVELEQVARSWLQHGARLVVITLGERGAAVWRSDGSGFTVPGRRVQVVDTVGAGDAFTAGLLGGLAGLGLISAEALGAAAEADLGEVVRRAVLVAALTCRRSGAEPPTARQVDAASAATS